MTELEAKVLSAIADSVRENRAVWLMERSGTRAYRDLLTELTVQAADWLQADDATVEFWGTDSDGEAWRIHLREL